MVPRENKNKTAIKEELTTKVDLPAKQIYHQEINDRVVPY